MDGSSFLIKRLSYWQRIYKAYLTKNKSQLSFWHGEPEVNQNIDIDFPKAYYMKFYYKAMYNGDYDDNLIPLLDYHGSIGKQYNPIAISQYGLGNYNLFLIEENQKYKDAFLRSADWHISNLEKNNFGLYVWMHHFDFEYRDKLVAPWYSGLAQGLGLSLLARAYIETKNIKYFEAAQKAWISMEKSVEMGGVIYKDQRSNLWIEEYIVEPPTHILNGFIWALFGVYDCWKLLKLENAKLLFDQCVNTLNYNLETYDNNIWSLYEHSGLKMEMYASPFYHNLHIVQLEILSKITKNNKFLETSIKWADYKNKNFNRYYSFIHKCIFKIINY
jgi:heparosan-N-sulfate-glucuronate 5-epimerase